MEEKICSALKLTKLRQQSFCRSLDEIHEQASSILALQRKNIETHFDSTFISIEDSAKELHTKERRLEEREKEADSKEKEFEERCKEFIKLRDAEVEEHYREIESKEKDFEDRRREVELERKKLEGRRKEVEEEELSRKKFADEIELKEKEIQERRRELEMERKKLVEKIKLKEEKIEEWRKEIEVERKKLVEGIESKEKKIEERQKEIEVERKKHDEEVELKEKQINEGYIDVSWLKLKVGEQHKECELKERRIEDRKVEERLKEFGLKEREVEERLKEVGMKGREVEERLKEVGLKGREVEERLKEVELMEKNVGKRNEEVELNRRKLEEGFRELELKSREVEEIIIGVELKEKELEERCRGVDLKGKQIEEVQLREKKLEERLREVELENKKCLERIKEFELKEKQPFDASNARVKSETVDCSLDANLHFSVKMDGRALQIFLNKGCKHDEKMKNEVSIALRLSSDPAKLVLDAMEGFYPPHLREGDMEFKEVVVKRSCNLLLEQLMKISPTIKPHVRKEATKVAFLWMTKMTVDNQHCLDILGFFFLLAAYGLASAFDSDELINRLVIIARNRQTPEFLRVLELGDKIPGFIQNLILKKLPTEAIRFIFAFEMVYRFPPETILRDYLACSKIAARKIRWSSNSIEGLVESLNRRVSDLVAVLKCVEDYKLESIFSPNTLKQQIKDVERQLSMRKTKLPDLGSKSPQPNLREKNRLALKAAASAPVPPSKSVSATKPALNSTMVACTATSTAPIGVISPSTIAAATTSPIAVASTASTTRSRVASFSSTSASPSASVPMTEPPYQGGNKRCQAQYRGSDKPPQEQHQGGNKRPRIAKSSEAPLRAPSLQSTGIAHTCPSLIGEK